LGQLTDLNISPYNDDFDEDKNFHRMIFRPSVPVQARELTGLQSILQNQIERFGNWAFKNGDIVSGCAISDIPVLPYVRLQDFQANSSSYDISTLKDVQIVASSNLQARVLTTSQGLASNYPNTNIAYIQYLNTGTLGEKSFSNTDQLTFYKIPRTGNNTLDTIAVVNVYSNASSNTFAIGNAHAISVSEGIVFISGAFVKVKSPTIGIVNPYSTYAGNSVVGFQAKESIVTENQDPSLNDNALGYPNENAPGAHRLKILPDLVTLDQVNASNTEGFNPIAVYNYGSLVNKSTSGSNVYSIVGEAIAQRVYEEAGNYVVNPFAVDTITTISGNSVVSSLDANNVLGRINPGIGYALGQRVELQKTAYINMRRGIDTQVNLSQQITFNYGGYFVLNEVAGSFPFANAQSVQLYDAPQSAVTNRLFSSLTPTGNNIGTASVRCFSYNSGTPGSNNAQYLLHVFNIALTGNSNSGNIKSVYYNGSTKGVGDLLSTGTVGSAFSDQLFSFGISGIKNLRDSSNNNNTQYVFRTKQTGTMSTNGVISVILGASAPGGTNILPYGTGILPDSDASSITVVGTANVDSGALGGTVTVSSISNTVTGVSTTFNSTFNIGEQIKVGSAVRTITYITNSTSLSVDSFFSANSSGSAYYKSYIAGKILPISQTFGGVSSYVNIANSTAFSIITNQAPSTSLSVDVTYDVLRTSVSPAQKQIRKNRFVKIDTSSNPNGPWCLGFPDVHKINKIYGSANGTFTTSGSDITSQFVFDTGQTDTTYGLGYIYPKTYVSSGNPSLLVCLDYFASNTTSGSDFYTIESYPIDDSNTANVNAIQTKDISLYVDSLGSKTTLRDYVDFRIPCNSTANDTGYVDTSNSSAVSTAITYATVSPSANITFNIPATGLNVPSYGKNFQSDFTNYLPRKDLIMITPDNVIKIKEGVSDVNPQTPLYPENAMVVAVFNIPPYPSLSTDQTDALLSLNQTAKTLIRDTSTAISSNLLTNRRYTMRDIGKLDSRISNLEYYTQLSLLEKKAADMTITDANGLNRFKNGIFVDAFSSFALSDVSNQEYTINIDTSDCVARPAIQREVINIDFATSPSVQKTGRVISLPYTEVSFLTQPFSTRYRSSARVAYSWNGNIVLIPSFDNHNDIINTGSINISIDNTTPWREFASSPFGSVWGDWRTNTEAVSTSVINGEVLDIDFDLGNITGYFGGGGAGGIQNAAAAAAKAAGFSEDVIAQGNYNIYWNHGPAFIWNGT
jgi:hypothetical protein